MVIRTKFLKIRKKTLLHKKSGLVDLKAVVVKHLCAGLAWSVHPALPGCWPERPQQRVSRRRSAVAWRPHSQNLRPLSHGSVIWGSGTSNPAFWGASLAFSDSWKWQIISLCVWNFAFPWLCPGIWVHSTVLNAVACKRSWDLLCRTSSFALLFWKCFILSSLYCHMCCIINLSVFTRTPATVLVRTVSNLWIPWEIMDMFNIRSFNNTYHARAFVYTTSLRTKVCITCLS